MKGSTMVDIVVGRIVEVHLHIHHLQQYGVNVSALVDRWKIVLEEDYNLLRQLTTKTQYEDAYQDIVEGLNQWS